MRRLPDYYERHPRDPKEPWKDRIPDGVWKVVEVGILLGIVLTLVLGGVVP